MNRQSRDLVSSCELAGGHVVPILNFLAWKLDAQGITAQTIALLYAL